MPWKQVWVPPTTDKSIEVLPGDKDTPPDGFELDESRLLYGGLTTAHKRSPYTAAYHCRFCEGWIAGHASDSQVNTLGPLSGRRGTEYHCRRCGHELAFSGMMS